MPIEPSFKLAFTISQLRLLSECPTLPNEIRDKAEKQVIKAIHGLVKPTHIAKGKEEVEAAQARIVAIATETEQEKEEREMRELDELDKQFGFK